MEKIKIWILRTNAVIYLHCLYTLVFVFTECGNFDSRAKKKKKCNAYNKTVSRVEEYLLCEGVFIKQICNWTNINDPRSVIKL
jgi:hypothetical protein